MVPFDPGTIFPANFGLNSNIHSQTKMKYWSGLCYNVNAEDFQEDGSDEPMEWYLFEDDFDQILEDAECESQSCSPVVCMRTLISLIDRLLENFEHGVEAEWLEPALFVNG